MDYIFQNEGVYSNDPDDRGGATRFGLSEKYLRGIGYEGVVEELTESSALSIYYSTLYDAYKLSRIEDWSVRTKLLDVMVNFGANTGISIFQNSVNEYGKFHIKVDGILGKKTVYAINNTTSKLLLEKVKEISAQEYIDICISNPTQIKFLKGWMKRAFRIPK